MKKYIPVFVLLVVLIVLCLSGFANSDEVKEGKVDMPKFLRFGATQASSGHYVYAVAAARAIEKKCPGTRVSVMETALVDNISRINKGEMDIAINNMDVVYEAFNGMNKFKDNAQTNLRNLWNYAISYHFYVVRQGSGIKTLNDLNGKKFMPGAQGQAAELQTQQIFAALGIKPVYYRGSLDDGISAIKNNEIIGFLKIGSPGDSAIVNIQATNKIDFLGLSNEDIKKVREKYPHLKDIVLPANTFEGQRELKTWAVTNGIMTNKSMSNEVAYQIVKAIVEGYADQVESFPSLKSIKIPELTVSNTSIPLHPGAIKYYEEHGIMVPANLYPPGYRSK